MDNLSIKSIDQFDHATNVRAELLELTRKELTNEINLFKNDYRFKKNGIIKFKDVEVPCSIMFDSGATQTHIGRDLTPSLPKISNLHGTSSGAHGDAVPSDMYFFDLSIEDGPLLRNIVAFTCDGNTLILGMDVLSKINSRIYRDGDVCVWEFDTGSFDGTGIKGSETRFV